jgi:hypothetical protein
LVFKHHHEEQDSPPAMYACKTLRKGPIFKDNTLYPPVPQHILIGEVDIMQTLAGKSHCLKLESVYETPRDNIGSGILFGW